MTPVSDLVSVIIPAYNAERFIGETIRSVINQTYSVWELIIIIDGATDQTESIVQAFSKAHKNITYFKKPNSGVSQTRNVGLEKAQGEYLAFLDADDVWLPDNLEKKINALKEDPNLMWVFSDMYECDEKMGNCKLASTGRDENIIEDILLWEGEVVPGPCSNIIVRKSYLGGKIKFDRDFSSAADQDFTLQLAFKGGKGKRLPEPLWKYRVLGNSMSRNISVMEKEHLGVFKKAQKEGMFKDTHFRRKCFSNLYLILAGSWWKNGNNKFRGTYFLLKSIWTYPPNIHKLLNKSV